MPAAQWALAVVLLRQSMPGSPSSGKNSSRGRLTGPSFMGASLLLLPEQPKAFLVQASLFKEFPDPFKVVTKCS